MSFFFFFFFWVFIFPCQRPKYHWNVLLGTRLNFITLENTKTTEDQVSPYSKRITSPTNWLQDCTEKKPKEQWENILPGVFCGWNSQRPPISAAGRHSRWLHRLQGPSSQETHFRRLEIRIFHHGYQPLTTNPTHEIICLYSK